MIVLHAGFSSNRFFVWGERPLERSSAPARPPGRKPKNPRPPTLPYDAGGGELAAAVASTSAGLMPSAADVEAMVAWVPTVDRAPVASSPLIAQSPGSRAEPRLLPWTITVLPLSTEQAIDLLCACVNRETLAPGIVVGKDLAFWSAALRLAGALVARQHFLPGLTKDDGVYRAIWTPVFAGPDGERLARLARAMPAACRALTRKADRPPATGALSLLTDFIGALVDRLVRSGLAEGQPAIRAGGRGRKAAPAFESPHDEWLHALRSESGLMESKAPDLERMLSQLRDWQRPVAVSSLLPFRLSFRLEEPQSGTDATDEAVSRRAALPETGNGSWFIRYLLQATHDPSLLIPADEAWAPRGPARGILRRSGLEAREYLLRSLGQASGICPPIEKSLRSPAPGGYAADATGAYEFLSQWAGALEQAGFGVMLPAWWTRKGTKLQLTARANVKSPKMQGGSGLGLDELVQFDWEVALGGERLTLEELRVLARMKAPLVRLRGQWVHMSAEEIQAALEFWKGKDRDLATVREVVQMALGAVRTTGSLAFEGVSATGWVGSLVSQLEGRAGFEELAAPRSLRGVLRPYQRRGYSWLSFLRRWGLGACLADDMGLGKTIQTLALIQREWSSNGKLPALIICPTSVVGNWEKEAARFTPELPVLVHHGLGRTKGDAFRKASRKYAIVLTSYGLLHRDLEVLKEIRWSAVVLDEAQNIKNPETKQARAARAIAAQHRIALTGTPVENNVGDLWSILEFLNPGLLGTQADFKRNFFIPIQASREPEAMERLKRLSGPFILRRLKTDKAIIADLPEKMEMKLFCSLTKEQASLYAAVVREAEEALEGAEGIRRKGVILATLSKLKQVCNHPAHFLGDGSGIPGRSGKLNRLTEMLEEVLEVGDRALVFSQFFEMGQILKRHLEETFGRETLFLHGGVPKKQRDRMVERFQSEGDAAPFLFILSLKAGGTGLNLTHANHVFHFDRWWNPAVENQATDRAFRIGQRQRVQVHKLLCAGTLEEKIDEMIERKKAVAEKVVGTGEAWLTELSTADLKEIFALRSGAVGE